MHIKIPYFQLFSLSHPSLLLLGPRAAGAIKRLRWWSAPCCCRPRPHWDVPAGRKASTLARTRGGMRHGRRRPRTRPRRCFSLGASLSSPRSSRAAARISVKGTGDAVRLSGPNGGRGSWQRKASSAAECHTLPAVPLTRILRSSRLGAGAPQLASNAAAAHRQNGGITTPQPSLTSVMIRTAAPAVAAFY